MVPRLRKPGRSFKAVHEYLTQGKDGRSAEERLGWTHVLNLKTDDPEKAMRFMAYQHMAANEEKDAEGATGRRIDAPVFHWVLALKPERGTPDKNWWMEEVRSFMQEFGIEHHPTIIYEHKDEDHSHIHGVSTLIDPKTGKTISPEAAKALYYGHLKASRWAQRREEMRGQIECPQRVENNKRRDRGEYVKYRDPELEHKATITKLYFQSRDGRQFETALKKQLGLRIADGRRRVVLIDSSGKIISLARQIDGVRAKDIRAKLNGLELQDVEKMRDVILERSQREKEEETRRAVRGKLFRALDRNTASTNRLRERLEAVDASLERDYGQSKRTLQQEIQAMETEIENAGPVRRTWLKLSGQHDRRKKDIENKRRSLADIAKREEERRGELARIVEQRKARAVILNNRLSELQQPAPAQEQDRQPQQEVITSQAGRSSTRRRKEPTPEPMEQRPPAPATAREFGEAAGAEPQRERQKVTRRTGRSRDRGPEPER
jgi:hypothetical protein